MKLNILGVFRKMDMILWIFYGVITKLDYIKGPFLCILGSVLKVKIQNGGYCFGLLKFEIVVWGA